MQKPYHHRKEGKGFVVWEMGPERRQPLPLRGWLMSEPSRRRGCGRGCAIGCAALLLLPALIWLIATASTSSHVQAEIERLRKAGEPVDAAGIRAMIPHCAPGEDNAAMVYQEAFGRRVDPPGYADINGATSDRWTPQQWDIARQFVTGNADYFRLLDQASRIEKCEFDTNWDDMFNATFPQFAPMREASRALTTKAELLLADGRIDEAAATCATHYRLARHTEQNPTLIGQLVAVAVRGIGNKELERVLSQGTPSVATCRRMFTEMDDPQRLQAWVNAMRAERVFGLQAFEMVEEGRGAVLAQFEDNPSRQAAMLLALGTVGRPLLNSSKQYYLDCLQGYVEALGLPWPQAKAKADALEAQQSHLPQYAWLTSMLMPVFSRALDTRDRELAYLGASRIALAAKAYKGEHGAYPTSLADLTKAGWKLPLDPFTGQAYRYQQVGKGFMVYSLGPDLKDDGGVDYKYGTSPTQPGHDFVFHVAR